MRRFNIHITTTSSNDKTSTVATILILKYLRRQLKNYEARVAAARQRPESRKFLVMIPAVVNKKRRFRLELRHSIGVQTIGYSKEHVHTESLNWSVKTKHIAHT